MCLVVQDISDINLMKVGHERTLLNCPEDKDRQRFFAPEWDLSLGYSATVVVENWRTAETAAARRVKSMIRRCLACADEC